MCLQLRVVRAFKSYLEDFEERRSNYSIYSSHSIPKHVRMRQTLLETPVGQRPKSDNHLNIYNGNSVSQINRSQSGGFGSGRSSGHTPSPDRIKEQRTYSCENIWPLTCETVAGYSLNAPLNSACGELATVVVFTCKQVDLHSLSTHK